MFKILLALAPYYLRSRYKNPAKAIAGFFMMALLGGISAIFLLTALFIWVLQAYGAVAACLVVGTLFLGFSLLIYALLHVSKSKRVTPIKQEAVHTDPLATKLPDSIKNDPRIKDILEQITKNPIAAITAALTLGYVVSGEVTGKK